jgi:hypothetical protein
VASAEEVGDFNPKRVIDRVFPAIIDPNAVSAAEAESKVRPNELVIGVVMGGQARAYPVNMLCQPSREIVTDTLGGERIAVTWCHLCHNGLVFRAEHDGKPVTLVVSGMLWKRNLVMQDIETTSLWSHMLGRGMQGAMAGVTLEGVPCEITTWEDWVARHPDTTSLLLSRTMERYEKGFYEDLANFVVIYSALGKARAWRFSDLKDNLIVNDRFEGRPLLVLFDAGSTSARIFSRSLSSSPGERILTFEAAGSEGMKDVETGTIWERDTATAISGPLVGTSLVPLVGTMANEKAWQSFYPGGSVWEGTEAAVPPP